MKNHSRLFLVRKFSMSSAAAVAVATATATAASTASTFVVAEMDVSIVTEERIIGLVCPPRYLRNTR